MGVFADLRESETWKLISDISVGHWIWTVVIPFVLGFGGVLHDVSVEWIIAIFLVSFAAILTITYYWRKHKRLTQPPRRRRTASAKKNALRFAVVPIAILLLIVMRLVSLPNLIGSHIRIIKVEPYLTPKDSPPGKRALLNLYYLSDAGSPLTVQENRMVTFVDKHAEWGEHLELNEDKAWDQLRSQVRYPDHRFEVLPNHPMLSTVYDQTLELTDDQIQKVQTEQAALYVMNIFTYEDVLGVHESDVCVFLFGDPRLLHYCHKYNSPFFSSHISP